MKKYQILLIAFCIGLLKVYCQDYQKTIDDYIVDRRIDKHGKEIVGIIVPGIPPGDHHEPVAKPTRSAILLNYVPAFDWSFGCSPTAAAMAAGYYDNNGYPDMYSGSSNFGFMPLDNGIWGYDSINGENRALCPLSATRNGLDGLTQRGHVDDYWIAAGDTNPDPYITNGWTQHEWGDCTADFMCTSQSVHGNSDGSTTFYYYVNGTPLSATSGNDGSYGLRLFYESRGYDVLAYCNQIVYHPDTMPLGFTFDQYMDEIDAGRPVLIQLAGHTVLGFGYDATGQVVYVHDTWDYSDHAMTWGEPYAGMAHFGVGVVELEPSPHEIIANFSASLTREMINTPITLLDRTYGDPSSWYWSISPGTFSYIGGTSSSSPNPMVQFSQGGNYTVSLTVSDGVNSDNETKSYFLEIIDCEYFPFPILEDFSEDTLPFCWQNIDHIGNGQKWHFYHPGYWPAYTSTAYNGYVMINSDAYGGSGSQDADLVTPVLDLSEYTTVNLHFEHWFKQYATSSGTVSYSVNGGSTWTAIQSWTTNTQNAETFDQDMTAQVAGHAEVMFKWNYVGAWDYFWVLDDISITGTIPGLWTGKISTSWSTAGNWSDGNVPGSTVNVTIPETAQNWPVFTGNLVIGTHCRNLTMKGASHLTVTGNLTVTPGRQLHMNIESTLNVGGYITNPGNYNLKAWTDE